MDGGCANEVVGPARRTTTRPADVAVESACAGVFRPCGVRKRVLPRIYRQLRLPSEGLSCGAKPPV